MTHKSKEASDGSGTHVATDRSSFISWESDCTSNVIQVARKKYVGHHRIIHMEQSTSLNQFWGKTFVIVIKWRLIFYTWDGHNSSMWTPNQGLFLSLATE
jgi:hypothetical protein